MAVNITINGVIYSFPTEGDQDWGPQVTAFAQAIAASVLYKSGGVFTLTADADFGGAFGIKAIFKSRSLNIADAGVLRLANLDAISWRNAANSANLDLIVNASDQLLFNGTAFLTAPVALASLAPLTVTRAVVTDGAGLLTAATTTATEIGFVNGVTSPVQTQLNGKISASVMTANGSMIMRYGGIPIEIPIGAPDDILTVVSDSANWMPHRPAKLPVTVVTSGYIVDESEHGSLFLADPTSSTVGIFLPSPMAAAGVYFTFKDNANSASINPITIVPSGSDLIDNGGSYSISTDNGSVKLISDGTNWWSVGGV